MPQPLRLDRTSTAGRRLRPGRALLFVAAAVSLAWSCVAQAGDPFPCGATLSAEAALLRLNEARLRGSTCRAGATSTAAPLTWSEHLAEVAAVHAREMARLDRMTHVDSFHRGLPERLRALGYRYGTAVENLGVGQPSLDDVIDAWLESEGHCENLMNAAVLEFGLACIDARSGGPFGERRYWTIVLGAPPRPR